MSYKQILAIDDLKVSFKYSGSYINVVRGLSLKLYEGEILGIIGESGSGKSVSCASVMGILDSENSRIDSGSITFEGNDILKYTQKQMRNIRGQKISYIFQDAAAALNPYIKVGNQIEEVLKIHGEKYSKERVLGAMKDAGIENADLIYSMFPSQLSGGQCQRVMIAMCTICNPKILIADEPTTAIDASLQKKVLELLLSINKKYDTSLILVTHDFDVARYMCSRVLIMYGGLVMEEGPADKVFLNALHPYTAGLIKCAQSLDNNEAVLHSLDGIALSPAEYKDECPFYNRCYKKSPECKKHIPPLTELENGRKVRCINIDAGD
jgi:oligopeptide/dipeptide ABC transporter ATP-binding protein